MPAGAADSTYKHVIEVEGERASAQLAAFEKHLASTGSAATEMRAQFEASATAMARVLGRIEKQNEAAEAIRKAREEAAAFGKQVSQATETAGDNVISLTSRMKSLGGPITGVRAAMSAFGVANNTAVGAVAQLTHGLLGLGAKAGLIGVAVTAAGYAVSKLVEHQQEVAAADRAFAALAASAKVSERELRMVGDAWAAMGVEIQASAVPALIAAGREAGLTTTQIIQIADEAKRAADIAGGDFAGGFQTALGKVKADATNVAEELRKVNEEIARAATGYTNSKLLAGDALVEKAASEAAAAKAALDAAQRSQRSFDGSGMSGAEMVKRRIALADAVAKAEQDLRSKNEQHAAAVDARKKTREQMTSQAEMQAIRETLEEDEQAQKERERLNEQLRQNRIAATQAVLAAERALSQEQMALALGVAQASVSALGVEATARERTVAALAVLDAKQAAEESAARNAAAAEVAQIEQDKRLTANERATAVAAIEQRLAAQIQRIGVEAHGARLAAEQEYVRARREQAQQIADFIATREAAATFNVDRETAARVVAVQKEAAERGKAIDRMLRDSEISEEQAAELRVQIDADANAAILKARKEGAERWKQAQLAALKEASEGLGHTQFERLLKSIGVTEKAIEEMRVSFAEMGAEGHAAWGAIGAAAEVGALAVQQAAQLAQQSMQAWILDNRYAQELAVRDVQDRLLQQDAAYQATIDQLARETDAKRKAELQAKATAIQERAYGQARKQAAAEQEIAQKKQVAAAVAAIAAESAVRAVYESALALASLAMGDARGAALHGAAAAAFVALGGTAAAVASGISSSASRDELRLSERERDRESRSQQLESERAARRNEAVSRQAKDGGVNLTIQFTGSAFATQAQIGQAVDEALKAWEAYR